MKGRGGKGARGRRGMGARGQGGMGMRGCGVHGWFCVKVSCSVGQTIPNDYNPNDNNVVCFQL